MLQNQRVTVMGLGRFGGGVGVARFLVARGARVLVTDMVPAAELAASMKQLEGLPIEFRLGEHRVEDFTSADLVVVNPAVDPRNNVYLQAAKAAGVKLTSEIRLLIEHLPNPRSVVGVTGSAGKSTTSALINHALVQLVRDGLHPGVHFGGNIGGSLLSRLDQIQPDHTVVLELSSFMLEAMAHDAWSPHISLITNLTPNHLDRHSDFAGYVKAKQVILDHQTASDYALLGPGVQPHVIKPHGAAFLFDDVSALPRVDTLLPGPHNQINAMMALKTLSLLGISDRDARDAISTFPGLEHRLQFVCDHAGVKYYNDSKATTPEATLVALRSFPPGRVHVILGGYDKGSDYAALAGFASEHCHAIYTIGKTGDKIASLVDASNVSIESTHGGPTITSCGGTGDGPRATLVRCQTLDAALATSRDHVRQGDIVLLSTGCASWDQYTNYEQRGSAFVEAVLKYTGEGSPSPKIS